MGITSDCLMPSWLWTLALQSQWCHISAAKEKVLLWQVMKLRQFGVRAPSPLLAQCTACAGVEILCFSTICPILLWYHSRALCQSISGQIWAASAYWVLPQCGSIAPASVVNRAV
jgi:hypothetical protein